MHIHSRVHKRKNTCKHTRAHMQTYAHAHTHTHGCRKTAEFRFKLWRLFHTALDPKAQQVAFAPGSLLEGHFRPPGGQSPWVKAGARPAGGKPETLQTPGGFGMQPADSAEEHCAQRGGGLSPAIKPGPEPEARALALTQLCPTPQDPTPSLPTSSR